MGKGRQEYKQQNRVLPIYQAISNANIWANIKLIHVFVQ